MKLKIAAEVVPLFVTLADVPAAPVVVVPTLTVAAVPVGPVGPVGPVDPVGPCGIPKLKTAAEVVPTLVTVAGEPAVNVEVVPTEIVAALPGGPGGPEGPGLPAGPVGPVGPVPPCVPVLTIVQAANVPEPPT